MAISLTKLQEEAPALVNLAKTAQVSLDKLGLDGHQAKVALCLDYSGSMRGLYADGVVQALTERVLALATRIDDDGAIDVFAFGSSAAYLGELTYQDFAGGVDRITRGLPWGSTNYAAAVQAVRNHYSTAAPQGAFGGPRLRGLFRKATEAVQAVTGAPAAPAEFPAYVMFVTDGAPDSETEASRQIGADPEEPIFWQFMGVGDDSFRYLRGLRAPNVGFFAATDVSRLADADLYARMLAKYPSWLPTAKRSGRLA